MARSQRKPSERVSRKESIKVNVKVSAKGNGKVNKQSKGATKVAKTKCSKCSKFLSGKNIQVKMCASCLRKIATLSNKSSAPSTKQKSLQNTKTKVANKKTSTKGNTPSNKTNIAANRKKSNSKTVKSPSKTYIPPNTTPNMRKGNDNKTKQNTKNSTKLNLKSNKKVATQRDLSVDGKMGLRGKKRSYVHLASGVSEEDENKAKKMKTQKSAITAVRVTTRNKKPTPKATEWLSTISPKGKSPKKEKSKLETKNKSPKRKSSSKTPSNSKPNSPSKRSVVQKKSTPSSDSKKSVKRPSKKHSPATTHSVNTTPVTKTTTPKRSSTRRSAKCTSDNVQKKTRSSPAKPLSRAAKKVDSLKSSSTNLKDSVLFAEEILDDILTSVTKSCEISLLSDTNNSLEDINPQIDCSQTQGNNMTECEDDSNEKEAKLNGVTRDEGLDVSAADDIELHLSPESSETKMDIVETEININDNQDKDEVRDTSECPQIDSSEVHKKIHEIEESYEPKGTVTEISILNGECYKTTEDKTASAANKPLGKKLETKENGLSESFAHDSLESTSEVTNGCPSKSKNDILATNQVQSKDKNVKSPESTDSEEKSNCNLSSKKASYTSIMIEHSKSLYIQGKMADEGSIHSPASKNEEQTNAERFDISHKCHSRQELLTAKNANPHFENMGGCKSDGQTMPLITDSNDRNTKNYEESFSAGFGECQVIDQTVLPTQSSYVGDEKINEEMLLKYDEHKTQKYGILPSNAPKKDSKDVMIKNSLELVTDDAKDHISKNGELPETGHHNCKNGSENMVLNSLKEHKDQTGGVLLNNDSGKTEDSKNESTLLLIKKSDVCISGAELLPSKEFTTDKNASVKVLKTEDGNNDKSLVNKTYENVNETDQKLLEKNDLKSDGRLITSELVSINDKVNENQIVDVAHVVIDSHHKTSSFTEPLKQGCDSKKADKITSIIAGSVNDHVGKPEGKTRHQEFQTEESKTAQGIELNQFKNKPYIKADEGKSEKENFCQQEKYQKEELKETQSDESGVSSNKIETKLDEDRTEEALQSYKEGSPEIKEYKTIQSDEGAMSPTEIEIKTEKCETKEGPTYQEGQSHLLERNKSTQCDQSGKLSKQNEIELDENETADSLLCEKDISPELCDYKISQSDQKVISPSQIETKTKEESTHNLPLESEVSESRDGETTESRGEETSKSKDEETSKSRDEETPLGEKEKMPKLEDNKTKQSDQREIPPSLIEIKTDDKITNSSPQESKASESREEEPPSSHKEIDQREPIFNQVSEQKYANNLPIESEAPVSRIESPMNVDNKTDFDNNEKCDELTLKEEERREDCISIDGTDVESMQCNSETRSSNRMSVDEEVVTMDIDQDDIAIVDGDCQNFGIKVVNELNMEVN